MVESEAVTEDELFGFFQMVHLEGGSVGERHRPKHHLDVNLGQSRVPFPALSILLLLALIRLKIRVKHTCPPLC